MSRFDERASAWDAKPRRIKLARDVVNSIIKYAKPEKGIDIIDFGTGTGLIALGLVDYAKAIKGYDNSQGMLDVLANKAREAGISNLETAYIDIDKDDFESESTDLVTCSMVAHHLDSPEVFFQKAYDALREGGKLCVADLAYTEIPFHEEVPEGVKHEGFSREWVVEAFENCGFSSVQFETGAFIEKERDGKKLEFEVFLAIGVK